MREPVQAEELIALAEHVEHREPVAVNGSVDSRSAGDEAMRAGRYFDAVREYGAWLRSLRADDASTPS